MICKREFLNILKSYIILCSRYINKKVNKNNQPKSFLPILAPKLLKMYEKLAVARLAKAAKNERAKETSEKRAENLLKNQLNCLREKVKELEESLLTKEETGKVVVNNVIIQDLIDHMESSSDDCVYEIHMSENFDITFFGLDP